MKEIGHENINKLRKEQFLKGHRMYQITQNRTAILNGLSVGPLETPKHIERTNYNFLEVH